MMNHHPKIGVIRDLFPENFLHVFHFLAITFCVIGKACSNTRLHAALDDRYAYECLQDEDQIHRTLVESKQLLSKRQLRIYVMESFEENLFFNLKEDENTYIISAELVLTCAEKKMVGILRIHTEMFVLFRIFQFQEEIVHCILNIFLQLLFVLWVELVEKFMYVIPLFKHSIVFLFVDEVQ